MNSIQLKSRAKINLSIDVLGKREDGYHLVEMIMQTIDLFDKIKNSLNFEAVSLEAAFKTNKSFSEPYAIAKEKLNDFWNDYDNGLSTDKLCKKYVTKPFRLPNLLFLRRLKKRYNWVIKRK